MTLQKPTTRPNQPKEPTKELVGREGGSIIDNGRSRGIADQVLSALIVESPPTLFPAVGRSKGRRIVNDSSGILDDPT